MKLKRLIWSAPPAAAGLCGAILAFGAISTASADDVTANLNQSEAGRLSIFHDFGTSSIGSTPSDIPDSTDGGMLTGYLGRWATDTPTPSDKSFSVSATPVVGYDSDPEGLKDERGSIFGGAELAANYALNLTASNGDPTIFDVGYDATGAVYKGTVKQGDNLQQTVSAGAQHKMFNDAFVFSGGFRDQFTIDHGTAFLNAIDLSTGGEVFWFPQLSTELSYRYSHLDFYFPDVVKQQDPDANRDVLSLAMHLFPLPQTRNATVGESPDLLTDFLRSSLRSATVGYAYVWNTSDGSDYKYQANRVFFGLDDLRPFHTKNLSFDLNYAHEWQQYFNTNNTELGDVISGKSTLRRNDHLDVFTMRANARLADLARNRGTLGGFLQWDYIRDESNIPNRDFNEFIVSTGIEYRY
jgi:hypothetical protein